MPKFRIGACTHRFKIEQLEAVLQHKKKQLAKLERIRRVLTEREQVITRCISQQVDLLQVLGKLAFSLPQPNDAAYEAKATAAVEALLKDMEVAQLMQAADSISTFANTSSADTSNLDSSEQAPQQQQQQQQEEQQQQQQQQPLEQEPFTVVTIRNFLQSPDHMQTLRRMGSATVEDLAGILKDQTMQLGFAVALYPSKTYLDATALAAAKDERQRRSMEAANKRLHAALNTLGTTNVLLHIVGDKVLQLSTLNLDTLQPEAPHEGFWEEVAAKLTIPQEHMAQLHTGFLLYNSQRTELTGQMQQTMTQLQQLLKASVQQPALQAGPPAQQQPQQRQRQLQRSSLDSPELPRAGSSTSSDNSSSSSSFTHAHQGVHSRALDMLECMEDADRLLRQLSRQVGSLREASRCLIFQFANVLDPLQLSLSVVHAWPYLVQPPPVVEVLVKQQVAQQQREDGSGDDGGG